MLKLKLKLKLTVKVRVRVKVKVRVNCQLYLRSAASYFTRSVFLLDGRFFFCIEWFCYPWSYSCFGVFCVSSSNGLVTFFLWWWFLFNVGNVGKCSVFCVGSRAMSAMDGDLQDRQRIRSIYNLFFLLEFLLHISLHIFYLSCTFFYLIARVVNLFTMKNTIPAMHH